MAGSGWRAPWRSRRVGRAELMGVYRVLFEAFGPQGWWPAASPFEVVVGAILTQGTNWRNVERAIGNLRRERALSPRRLAALPRERLARLIRPAGYHHVKADRLRSFLRHLARHHGGSVRRLLSAPAAPLREELLGVHGIGPETADSILLYAAARPVFVVDAYTRRILSRHGLAAADLGYAPLQAIFSRALPPDAALFNEFHALLVRLGKEYCRPRHPRCPDCPLAVPPPAVASPG